MKDQIIIEQNKEVSLAISKKAMGILAMTPPKEKGAPRGLKRLIRIRKNVFRELDALNKELRRHKPSEIGIAFH